MNCFEPPYEYQLKLPLPETPETIDKPDLKIVEQSSAINDSPPDKIKQIVRITGYVRSGEDFKDHPRVLNGASDLLVEIFGDSGRHARSAVGASGLPLGAPVEVEMIVEIVP